MAPNSIRTQLRHWARTMGITFEVTLRQNFTDAFIVFAIIVQPIIIAVIALWMLRERGGDYAIFVVVGSGMTGLWSSLLFISGNSITEERWVGTLENLVAAPTPMQVVVLGKNLANVVQSLLSMIASYLLVVLLFQLDVSIANPLLFIVSLFLMVISFIAFGLIMASLFILTPALRDFQNGLEFPVYILCGFLFPIALLPGWTTPISYLLTPYWAARALHGAASGTASVNEIMLSWTMMLVFGAIYVFASRGLFRYVLRKARVDATLGMQ
jgi:ABC-2 type transport system permease protein